MGGSVPKAMIRIGAPQSGHTERGEAREQLERGQRQGGCPRTGLGTVVDEMLGIELMQPFQGEGWASAIAQQAFTPGTIGRLDAHRAIDRETPAVRPLRHRLRVGIRKQAAAHEARQESAT